MSILGDLEPDVRAAALAYLATAVGHELSAEAGLAEAPAFLIGDAVRIAQLMLLAADQARAAQPPVPRRSGPLSAVDAQALRLDLGAEALAVIAWMPGDESVDLVLAASRNRSLSHRSTPSQFSDLSAAIAAAFPSSAPAPEPQP